MFKLNCQTAILAMNKSTFSFPKILLITRHDNGIDIKVISYLKGNVSIFDAPFLDSYIHNFFGDPFLCCAFHINVVTV